MIAYKGFTSDMKARLGNHSKQDYQFKIGVTAREDEAQCARTGFHCAENPLDVLSYYSGKRDRYCIVKAEGDIHEDGNGSRISCTELTPVKEIDRKRLGVHAVNYIINHPEMEDGKYVQQDKGIADDYWCIVRGKNPIGSGKEGTWLLLLKEKKNSREIEKVSTFEVDGKTILPGKFYDMEGRIVDDKGRT